VWRIRIPAGAYSGQYQSAGLRVGASIIVFHAGFVG